MTKFSTPSYHRHRLVTTGSVLKYATCLQPNHRDRLAYRETKHFSDKILSFNKVGLEKN